MEPLDPRIESRMRELRDGPAPWFYEDLFTLIRGCVRLARALRPEAGAQDGSPQPGVAQPETGTERRRAVPKRGEDRDLQRERRERPAAAAHRMAR